MQPVRKIHQVFLCNFSIISAQYSKKFKNEVLVSKVVKAGNEATIFLCSRCVSCVLDANHKY